MLPPTTYGEWTVALDHAASNSHDGEVMAALSMGSLGTNGASTRRLLERIVEFENAALKRQVTRFQRDVSLMPGDAMADDLLLLVRRFSLRCKGLLFFRRLAFMPPGPVDELNTAVCSQVERVLDELARHLEREMTDSPDSAVSDALYFVGRLKQQWKKGGQIEQLRRDEG